MALRVHLSLTNKEHIDYCRFDCAYEKCYMSLLLLSFYKIYIIAGLVIATLNINGLNNQIKQKQLINFINFHKIDILLLQEHNIRNMEKNCEELNDACIVELNLAISLKGGTAILINRKSPIQVLCSEKSADSRIMSIEFR